MSIAVPGAAADDGRGRLSRSRLPKPVPGKICIEAKPDAAEVKRLEKENAKLRRKLEQAEAIIAAQKKLARLLETLNEDEQS